MTPSDRRWLGASISWTILILFSSTSLAGTLSEAGFRWIFGGLPDSPHGWLHFLAEKTVHVTLFFVLGVLLVHVFTGPESRRMGKAILTGLAIGAASEFLQRLFPDRDPAWRDVLINVASASLGAWAAAQRATTRSAAPGSDRL